MATYSASRGNRFQSLSHRAVLEIVGLVVSAVTIAVLAVSLAFAGATSTSSTQPGAGGGAHAPVTTPLSCNPTRVPHPC